MYRFKPTRILTLLAIVFLAAAPVAMGQNLLSDGDFEGAGEAGGWTIWEERGDNTADLDYTTDLPTGGSGEGLHFLSTAPGGAGSGEWSNIGVYQALDLEAASSYRLRGVAKELPATGDTGYWLQIYLGTTEPQPGDDYTEGEIVALEQDTPDWGDNPDGAFEGAVMTTDAVTY